MKILPKQTKRCKRSLRRKAVPTTGLAKCDERRQTASVCTAQCWMATLSAPTCSGVSYITTVSAMFYPARAEIEFCLRLKFLQWGRAREQPPPASPATLGSFHTEPSTEPRRYLVPEGTWPFRFPVRGLKSDPRAFQTRQQICSASSRCAAVACGTIPCTHLGWEC